MSCVVSQWTVFYPDLLYSILYHFVSFRTVSYYTGLYYTKKFYLEQEQPSHEKLRSHVTTVH